MRKGDKEADMYELLQKEQHSEYEEFASQHANGSFMQSIGWAKVKNNWGHHVLVSRGRNGRIKGGVSILTQELRGYGKNYLYAPRGPVMDYDDEETFSDLMEGIRDVAKERDAFHFRMDPMVSSDDQGFIDMARRHGFLYNPITRDGDTVQRRCSYIIDLTKFRGDTGTLYNSFLPKWRYNIRLAQKKGVECRICGTEALGDFMKLYQETGLRDNFVARPESYICRIIDSFGEKARLYMCYVDERPISGAVCINYAGRTSYVYGASSGSERNRMPNHLMQWNMMLWAMESGCSVYDFREIPMNRDGTDPLDGIYRFKKGFNGEVITYAGEFDLIFDEEVKRASDLERERQREEILKMKSSRER